MATPFKLRNGMLLLSTEAPGGIYNAAQLKKIAQLCEGDAAIVKATEDQRLALFVPEAKAKAVAAELKATGLGIRNYQDGLHQPVNCIGELCGEHLQDAMGLSMDLSQELAKISLSSPLKIGINGCARCCVPTHTLDVSAIGDSTGYRVSLGGKNSQIPEMASFMAEGVPADKLPKMLAAVVQIYKELAETGESLQDVMERCGAGRFVEALAPYSQDAAGDDGDPFGAPGDAGAVSEDASSTEGASGTVEVEDLGTFEPVASLDDDPTMSGEPEVLGGDPELLGNEHISVGLLDAEPEMMDVEPAMNVTKAGTVASGPALDDIGGDDIPLDDGLMDDMGMDDIAITADAGGSLPDDLAPFPDEDIVLAPDGARDDGLTLDDGLGDELTDEFLGKVEPEMIDAVAEAPAEPLEDLGSLEELEELPFDESDLAVVTPVAAPASAPVKAAAAATKAASAPKAASGAAVATIGSEDDEDLAAAVEVEGDEADAFEAKLEESIADEESHPIAEDENSADRLAAMQLVESGTQLPSVDAVAANLGVDDSFDNLGIDHHDDEVPIESDEVPDVGAEFEPEEIGHDDSATAATAPASVAPAPTPPRPIALAPAPAAAVSGFHFRGIDVGEGGRLTLTFSNGASVVLDPRTMAPGVTREFSVGGLRLVITQAAAGFSVDVDGVGIFLPVQAA